MGGGAEVGGGTGADVRVNVGGGNGLVVGNSVEAGVSVIATAGATSDTLGVRVGDGEGSHSLVRVSAVQPATHTSTTNIPTSPGRFLMTLIAPINHQVRRTWQMRRTFTVHYLFSS